MPKEHELILTTVWVESNVNIVSIIFHFEQVELTGLSSEKNV